MTHHIKILDVVALSRPLEKQGLDRGLVGTVVEQLADHVFEVEFSDEDGRTYATAAVPADQLIVLRYKPVQAA
ncbi:MAG TPA: DUF4926 domain-containing protein [Humisphaera sp.]|nr:DUF4926 domain-containing protein [Humisphaera sp.]